MALENTSGRNVASYYGPRDNVSKFGGDQGSKGRVKTAVWSFTYEDVNADFASADLGAGGLAYAIPAGAVIQSATMNITEAFDGTLQTVSIGLEDSAGAAIDVDGIDVTVDVLGAGVSSVACDGALVGATIGEADGYVALVGAAADSTTGAFELIVEYSY